MFSITPQPWWITRQQSSIPYRPTPACPLWTLQLRVPACSGQCPPAAKWTSLHTSWQRCNYREQFWGHRGVRNLQQKFTLLDFETAEKVKKHLQECVLMVLYDFSVPMSPDKQNEAVIRQDSFHYFYLHSGFMWQVTSSMKKTSYMFVFWLSSG